MGEPEQPTASASKSHTDPATDKLPGLQAAALSEDQRSEILPLLEETASVSKQRRVTGTVKVETRTDLREEIAEVTLNRLVIDVLRVPVNRLIEQPPEIRTEGDTTIIPIIEERFIVVKQLFLKEEVHIRHRTERETVQKNVKLRRQHAVVHRVGNEGRSIEPEGSIASDPFVAEP